MKIKLFKNHGSQLLAAISSFIILAGGVFGFNSLHSSNPSKEKVAYQSEVTTNSSLTVEFLDVGQGNCVLAESDGHYILIDGGDNKHSSYVVSYLKNKNITTLDYVIVSHYDADHLSGIIGVMHQFDIDNIIAPDYSATTKTYNSFTSLLTEKNYTPIHPAVGDTFYFGDSAFQVVCPDKYTYDDENNNSIGIRLTDSFHSFLILGDAETQSEKAMLNSSIALKSDVYMVSHHGSSSSSSKEFLAAVNPQYSVISVGADNDYGHPTEKTLNKLNDINSIIFRTDINGTIRAISGENSLVWETEK